MLLIRSKPHPEAEAQHQKAVAPYFSSGGGEESDFWLCNGHFSLTSTKMFPAFKVQTVASWVVDPGLCIHYGLRTTCITENPNPCALSVAQHVCSSLPISACNGGK